MPEIAIGALVALDEVTGPPGAEAGSEPPSGRATGPTAGARDVFAPPPAVLAPAERDGPRNPSAPRNAFAPASDGEAAGDGAGDGELGVERSTRAIRITNLRERERAQAQAAPPRAAVTASATTPRRPIGGLVLAVVLIGAVAAAVVALVSRRAPAVVRPPGVSIRIVAPEPTEVMIDGHAAGKTPLTLQRPAGTQPILITAPTGARQIVPDRDQVIDLARP